MPCRKKLLRVRPRQVFVHWYTNFWLNDFIMGVRNMILARVWSTVKYTHTLSRLFSWRVWPHSKCDKSTTENASIYREIFGVVLKVQCKWNNISNNYNGDNRLHRNTQKERHENIIRKGDGQLAGKWEQIFSRSADGNSNNRPNEWGRNNPLEANDTVINSNKYDEGSRRPVTTEPCLNHTPFRNRFGLILFRLIRYWRKGGNSQRGRRSRGFVYQFQHPPPDTGVAQPKTVIGLLVYRRV